MSNVKDFKEFKTRVINCMVFQPVEHSEFYEMLNQWYIDFKRTKYDTVEEWCEFWFEDVSFDTHSYMLKAKAIKERDNH